MQSAGSNALTGCSPSSLAVLLRDDGTPLDELLDLLSPIVQSRVARALLRRGAASRGQDIRTQVEDITQEVFVALFEDRARTLRAWDPERGLSLANFVGLVAEREVASILRCARRSPWTEEPAEDLDETGEPGQPIDELVGNRELVARLLDRLRETLSPLGFSLFEKLLVEERSVADVSAETGMSADALHAWTSRLRKQVRKLASELMSGSERNRRTPG